MQMKPIFFDKKKRYAQGILAQENYRCRYILSHMVKAGIGERLPSIIMSVNDSEVRNQLALAAASFQ